MEGTWLFALDWIIRLAALLWIPTRTTPSAARSWLLLIGFVPVLGLPLYLALGHPWLSRKRVLRQGLASQVIREWQRELTALRWQPQENSVAAELVPLVEHQGDFMPTRGNALELLDDYHASLHLLINDIDGARERVHLLYYLMFDDAVGDAVVAALQRAAARGVSCRLLLDAVGAKRGLRAYRQCLRSHGVEVHAMLPGGLRWRRSGRMDLRNHRKIAVIDNRVAYIGSQNLACPDFVPHFPNRELVARVRGPVVNHLEAVFLSDWFVETGQRLEIRLDAPECVQNVPTQLVASGPAYPYENARDAVNTMIHLARRRVVLVTPYFVPDEATLSALRIAGASGVDVQVILPESSDDYL
ncbi:MAG TPA: phospholipase D-like domain-containing protein, partial [Xylella taiwanensis]